eukprot:361885-Chlamydomonas_euryale.AAC.6
MTAYLPSRTMVMSMSAAAAADASAASAPCPSSASSFGTHPLDTASACVQARAKRGSENSAWALECGAIEGDHDRRRWKGTGDLWYVGRSTA